jgi:hypothetical protein
MERPIRNIISRYTFNYLFYLPYDSWELGDY